VAVAVALAIPAVSGAQTRRSSKTVKVSERDFHITVPKRLPAGDVVIRLKNRGPDDHEFFVARAGDGELPMRDDGLTVDEDAIEHRTVGSLEAGHAGSVRHLRLHLRPGRYVMFCNMSGHYLAGMDTDVVVKP
jgi:uncharacterized cupredoxin-like copper-binding protein